MNLFLNAAVFAMTTLITVYPFSIGDGKTVVSYTDSNGNEVVYASKMILFPDGGKEYDFNIDGKLAYTRIPPYSFDESTATDEQLAFYGIPYSKDEIGGLPRNDPQLKNMKMVDCDHMIIMRNVHFSPAKTN